MEKLPILKVYDIDYSFIVKNYLNPEMWSKKWTLFQYKGFVFSLRLMRIDCDENKIVFYVYLEDTIDTKKYWDDWDAYPNITQEPVFYSLYVGDVKFLKNKIYTAMKACIERLECKRCKGLDEYQEMIEDRNSEIEVLEKIAEEFLDKNNVHNEEIRNGYIEYYLQNNSYLEEQMKLFVTEKKYKLLTDLYLVLAESQNDEKLIKRVLEEDEEHTNVYEEVKQYMKNLEREEFLDELRDNLEDI